VLHLMPDGKIAPHEPTAGVRVAGDELLYDRPPGSDLLPFPDAGEG